VKNTIYVPSLNEFRAAFGCECDLNEDYNYVCTFYDQNNRCISLAFSDISGTFSLILQEGDKVLVNIYNEFLYEVSIDEKDQLISVKFRLNQLIQEMKIIVWPNFLVSFNLFKDN
jgi:hypothetical protein